MKITLFKKEFDVVPAWEDGSDPVKAYIVFEFVVNFKTMPFFSLKVIDKSFNYCNPFTAIFMAIESETVGMCKYTRLKERVRFLGLWKKL